MDEQEYIPSLENVERKILASVKFINFLLQEVRREDKTLKSGLGGSYAKYVGLSSPFEEAINCLRKVKGELDSYLGTVRSHLTTKYKKRFRSRDKERF